MRAPTESVRTGFVPYPKEEPCDDGWRSPAPCSRWQRPSRAQRRLQPHRRASRPSRLRCSTAVMDGVTITQLLTVGDVVPDSGGYRFESIPDGISVRIGTGGQIELYVNHETSKVPFPYNPSLHDERARRVAERLRQRPGEQADPRPERWCAQRLVRHPEQRGFPAVLLQLPRDQQGGVHQGHPVHERGVAGLRAPADELVASRAGSHCAGGERRRARARRRNGRVPRDLRDGQAQPRERRGDPRVRQARRHVR